MFLQPKKFKYKKSKKTYLTNLLATSGSKLRFGNFGIKAQEATRLTARQIEAVRQTVNRQLNRKGKLWITIFPHIPVTSKPTENRMGKGKGAIDHWVAVIRPGRVLFETDGVSYDVAKEALRLASQKLPFKTKFVVRHDFVI